MKRITMFFAAAMMLLLAAAPASAQDCSKAVSVVCQGFDSMKDQINKCNSLDQLISADFVETALGLVPDNKLPDACPDYVLTKADKKNIIKASYDMIDAMGKKMVELSAGAFDSTTVQFALSPYRDGIKSAVEVSSTLGEVTENLKFVK